MDEIEKAHPDVYNILLQVMDHATLTDNTGRKADFRQVDRDPHVQRRLARDERGARSGSAAPNAAGSRATKPTKLRAKEAVERMFSPEFRNRLDAIVSFQSLSPAVMETIVEKFILQLEAQLSERRVAITLAAGRAGVAGGEGLRPALRRAAAGAGHPDGGARPAHRRDPVRRARARRHGRDRPGRRRADVHAARPRRRRSAAAASLRVTA